MTLSERIRAAQMDSPVTLIGGNVPAHVPGAYTRLSCCGGVVRVVPASERPMSPFVRRALARELPTKEFGR